MATEAASNATTTKSVDAPQSIAKPPFDAKALAASDVVFRTADGVDFHAHKVVLCLASPFFADMFSLREPQTFGPEHLSDTPALSPEPIVIPEISPVWDTLLRLCYPVDSPTFPDIDHQELVLRAAIKYQMNKPSDIIRSSLRQSISSFTAARVFSIACKLQLEEEAYAAAAEKVEVEVDVIPQYSSGRGGWRARRGRGGNTSVVTSGGASQSDRKMKPRVFDFAHSMADVPAGAYYRLLHWRRTHVLPKSFIDAGDPSPTPITYLYKSDSDETDSKAGLDLSDANMILRSLDGKDFPYHRLLLRLSSCESILGSSQNERPTHSSEKELPIFRVAIMHDVLRDLLRMCHPSTNYEFDDPYRLWKLSQAAIKYEITPLIEALKKQMRCLLQKRPLAICLAAMRNDWRKEAEKAARVLIERRTMDEYEPILEDVPAIIYESIRLYHSRCIQSISLNIRRWTGDTQTDEWELPQKDSSSTQPITLSWPSVLGELKAESELSALIASTKKLNAAIAERLSKIKLEFPTAM